MDKQVACDCGAIIRKKDDDELVTAVRKHAMEVHQMNLTRDQILSMAEVIPSSAK